MTFGMLAALDPCHILVLHCQHCSYMTLTISKLYEHYLTHNCASECCLYQCSQCGIVGTHRNLLEEHCNAWHLNVEVTIKEISKATLNTDQNYNPKGKKCIFCEFRSTNDAMLHQHYTQLHNVYNVGSDVEPQYETHTSAPAAMPVPPSRAPPPVGMLQQTYPPPAPDIAKVISPHNSPQKRPFQPIMRRDITRLASSALHRRRGPYRPAYSHMRGISSTVPMSTTQLPRQNAVVSNSHLSTPSTSLPVVSHSSVPSSAPSTSVFSSGQSSSAAIQEVKESTMIVEPVEGDSTSPVKDVVRHTSGDDTSVAAVPVSESLVAQTMPSSGADVAPASEASETGVGHASESDAGGDDVIVIKEESDNELDEKPSNDFMPITISQLPSGDDSGQMGGEYEDDGYNYDFAQVSGSFSADSSFQQGADMYNPMEVGGMSQAVTSADGASAGLAMPGDPMTAGATGTAGAQQPGHDRLYRCSMCDYTTVYKGNLTKHLSKHSDRRYVCRTCRRTYKFASALSRHVRCSHGVASSHGDSTVIVPPP